MTIPRWVWIALALAMVTVFFWAATSDAVYEATSPSWLSFHVLLRKAYSIVAFALVAFIADKALGPSGRRVLRAVVLVATYSGVIEYAQWVRGSHEGLVWNAIDVVCGGVGGWIGARIGRLKLVWRA